MRVVGLGTITPAVAGRRVGAVVGAVGMVGDRTAVTRGVLGAAMTRGVLRAAMARGVLGAAARTTGMLGAEATGSDNQPAVAGLLG